MTKIIQFPLNAKMQEYLIDEQYRIYYEQEEEHYYYNPNDYKEKDLPKQAN